MPLGNTLGIFGAGFTGPKSFPGLALDLRTDSGVYSDGARHFTAASAQSLTIASNSTLQLGGTSSTICGWVKFDTAATACDVLTKYNGEGNFEYGIRTVSSRIEVSASSDGTLGNKASVSATTFGPLSSDVWYFVCFQYDSVNQLLKVSVNNSAFNTVALSGIYSGTNRFDLGSQKITQYLNGSLDSLGIWKRVLTAAEITWLYNSGNGRTATDLGTAGDGSALLTSAVSWWNLDEEVGTAYDAVGTNHLTASASSPTGVPGIAAGVSTDENWCGQFNGTTQSLSVANNAGLQTGNVDWFVSAWAMLDSDPSYKMIIDKADTGKYEYTLLFDATGKPSLNVYAADASVQNTVTGGTAATVGQWYHIFAGLDSTNNQLFLIVNGGTPVVATRTATLTASTAPVYIGIYPLSGSYGFAGRIDSVIFGKPPTSITPLAATIASTLWNNGQLLKPSSLTTAQRTAWGVVSGWDLDKKLGITADSIGTNTLTNNGAVTFAQGPGYLAGQVSKWVGEVGGNAVQALQAKRPAYVTGVQNSRPMILLDGVDDLLAVTVSLDTACTIFAVVKPIAFNCIVLGGDPGDYALYVYTTTVLMSAGSNSVSVAHGMTAGQVAILGISRNGTAVQFWKNGSKLGAVQTLAANSPLTIKQIGAYGGTYPVNGYIGDVLAYTAALSDSQMAQEFAWLNARWGAY